MNPETSHRGHHVSAYHAPDEVVAAANAVRLTPKQCVIAAVILLLLYAGLPWIWKFIEPLDDGGDYRIPYALSEDYWLYARYADDVAANDSTIPLVGDSVIWGQYVKPDETLSHALNAELGSQRFANMGLNGSHPVALAGLLKNYGGGLRNRKVILHYNPLWTTSKRRDLQSSKPTTFNHPQLVPQFYPPIPSYDASTAQRLSVAIGCRVPFLSWTNHLRKAYFHNDGLATWTVEHPYDNPFAAITLALPQPERTEPSQPVPWEEKDMQRQAFEWVKPADSLQWAFFTESLATLRNRGNDVFVVVGPFNEHLLTDESRLVYRQLRGEVLSWLESESVPHIAPDPLPSNLYADASHPLKQGYVLLAKELLEDEAFKAFMAD